MEYSRDTEKARVRERVVGEEVRRSQGSLGLLGRAVVRWVWEGQGSSVGGKWSHSGDIFEVELTGFAVADKRKR